MWSNNQITPILAAWHDWHVVGIELKMLNAAHAIRLFFIHAVNYWTRNVRVNVYLVSKEVLEIAIWGAFISQSKLLFAFSIGQLMNILHSQFYNDYTVSNRSPKEVQNWHKLRKQIMMRSLVSNENTNRSLLQLMNAHQTIILFTFWEMELRNNSVNSSED